MKQKQKIKSLTGLGKMTYREPSLEIELLGSYIGGLAVYHRHPGTSPDIPALSILIGSAIVCLVLD